MVVSSLILEYFWCYPADCHARNEVVVQWMVLVEPVHLFFCLSAFAKMMGAFAVPFRICPGFGRDEMIHTLSPMLAGEVKPCHSGWAYSIAEDSICQTESAGPPSWNAAISVSLYSHGMYATNFLSEPNPRASQIH